jgi:molybdopterin converting factor small subunit
MITISFHSFLRIELACRELHLQGDGINIRELLHLCEDRLQKPFAEKLLGEFTGNRFHRPMILVNGRSINQLHGLGTTVADGDLVTLLPPCGGG